MALGIGTSTWDFASPDFPAGATDFAAIAGNTEAAPFGAGPQVGGDPSTTDGAGVQHVNTGTGTSTAHPSTRAAHWSNLLDYKHGPLFWLALATILYFGLISIRVGARVGHTGFRAGTGR
jgi:hypothetical protein